MPDSSKQRSGGALFPQESRARSSLGLGALQKTKIAQQVEAAIAGIGAGESLFFDIHGRPYSDRAPFCQRQTPPLATFHRPSGSSGLEVYPGIMPSNPIFCRWYPVEDSEPLLQGPLQGPIVARSGDVLYLGRACAVEIPSKVQSAPLAPGECLALMLAVAKPGESILLGRAGVPSLDSTVSRIHCTVKILSKDEQKDGSFYMRVNAFPGIPASDSVVLWRENSRLEVLKSTAALSAGDRVWLGESVGDITVPRLS